MMFSLLTRSRCQLRVGVTTLSSKDRRLCQRLFIGSRGDSCIRSFVSSKDEKVQDPTSTTTPPLEGNGLFDRVLGLRSNIASPEFKSRWLMVLPAFGIHMCLGSPWAWSIMADVATREIGFVAPAAADWTLMQASFPMSIVFLMLGLSASVVGKWQIKVGARTAMAASACAFGGGSILGAAGIYFHSLPLLYFGYGFLGGTGIGLAYTPPVATLMQWFPDKKGIASGLTIAGFGSGALLFTPAVQYLMKHFAQMPMYLGPSNDFVQKVIAGKLYVEINGSDVEVVLAGATELAKIPYSLSEGLYVVGTGSTGAAEALAVMGATYFAIIMSSALTLKAPHPNYIESTAASLKASSKATAPLAVHNVTLEEAMKAPQFYLLGTTFFCLATGGMGMFSVAKPMMSEVFSSALPAIVTSAFASNFLLMLSTGNLGGRLGWAAISDAIGRRGVFTIFTVGSIPLYLFLPTLVENVVSTGSSLPLYGFCISATLAVSAMGGVFAILPAYEADLFGTKFVGAIHGRMLLFSSAAALAGPYLLITLRSFSEKAAIGELLSKISPEKFQSAFGVPMESAYELLASKTLTISKLLVLAPPGTLDPTPHLYDTTMYTLSGLMATAVIAHSLVRPMKTVAPTVIDVFAISAVAPDIVGVSSISDVAPATVVGTEDVSRTNKKSPEEVAGDRLVKK